MFRSLSLLIILIFSLFGCSNPKILDEIDDKPILIKCEVENLQITENDSIAIPNPMNPVIWKGFYDATSVEIHFTEIISTDGETESFYALFTRENACLKIDRAYKFYDGKKVAASAITQVNIQNFSIQKYVIEKQFAGIISYIDPHDKKFYTRKFWIELKPNSEEVVEILNFKNCLGDKFPIEIDVNNDKNIDFQLIAEEFKDLGNKPNFSTFTIKLISTNTTINQILSPKKSNSPYKVVFEPPFSSQNSQQYFDGVKNELDVFYQFDTPYERYNYFLSNKLTYREILSNDVKDYFLISIFMNGKQHFGWIQFQLDTTNCTVKIVETFLNPIPEEHVFVN